MSTEPPDEGLSDDELIAKLSDNPALRLALEYKIALWPYGHKNYPGGWGDEDYHKNCLP